MCNVDDLIDEMGVIVDKLKAELRDSQEKSSDYDKKVSEMYHRLEAMDKMSAVDGFYFARDFQQVLRERRMVKNKRDKCLSLMRSTSLDNAMSNVKRVQNRHKKYTKGWKVELGEGLEL